MLDSNNKALVVANGAASENGVGRGAVALAGPPTVVQDAPGVPSGLTAGPTMAGLMHALRRRWLLALTVAALGAASVVLAVMTVIPAKYVVLARMQVASRGDRAIFDNTEGEEDFQAFKGYLIAQLKNPLVLNAALGSEELKKYPGLQDRTAIVDWLQTDLKAEYKGPGVLELKLAGSRPEELAPLLNAICRSSIAKLSEADEARRRLRLQDLERNLNTRRSLLHKDEQHLRSLEERQGMDDYQTSKAKFESALAKMAAVEGKLLANGIDQNKFKQMITSGKAVLPEKEVDEFMTKDVVGVNLEIKMAKIDEDMADLKARYREGPALDQAIRQANAQKRALREEHDRRRQDVRGKMETKALESAKQMLEILVKEEGYLKSEMKRHEAEGNKVNPFKRPENMIALAKRIEDEHDALKKLNERMAQMKVEPGISSRVAVLQDAEEPTSKDFSKHYKLAGAGGVSVFALLLFGVAWLEFRSRRINTAAEISEGLGISLVGTLPNLPARARKPNPTSARDQHLQNQLSEAVDSIRTMLLHSARTEKLHVVMISSALGGEGKTSLATQLAASLARAWRKTLLLDGDLRNPAGHKLFDVPLEPGFSEVLRGEVGVADAVKSTPISRLWLMPAGHCDTHALQALAQDGVATMFDQLKEQYDFIIVDSCPVLPVADSLNLAQHVDGVIFSVLRDVSRSPAVYAAQQRLHNLGVRTLGAVVIGESSAGAYGYPARSA